MSHSLVRHCIRSLGDVNAVVGERQPVVNLPQRYQVALASREVLCYDRSRYITEQRIMIVIAPYHDEWPLEFAAIAASLREGLGEQALRIDHIGSTAVPGLSAKDILDVQLTVAVLDEALVAALTGLGYEPRGNVITDHRPPGADGPPEDWQKRLFRAPPGQRPTNLHVRLAGRPNQRYPLLFRDYLRAHPTAVEAYATLKRRLALMAGGDLNAYTDAKDPACDLIVIAAESWAQSTGWVPGPSDG